MKSTSKALIFTTSLLSSSSCSAFVATNPIISQHTCIASSSIVSSSPSHHTRQQHQIIKPSSQLQMATIAAEELATMSKEEQFEVLGVDDPEKLALGIDPDEVLEFIGTREDMINKIQEDIPKFSNDRSKAIAEVDKLLMDGEILDICIKCGQRKKEDPDWEPIMPREQTLPQKIVGFVSEYAVYLIFGLLAKDIGVEIALKKGYDVPSWLGSGKTLTDVTVAGGGADDATTAAVVGDVASGAAASADVLVSSVVDGIHHILV